MATPLRELSASSPASSLDAVLRSLPVGVLVAEAATGRLLQANERAREILGGELSLPIDLDEYAGRLIGFRPDGRQYAADEWPLVRALQEGEVVADEEVEVLLDSGERRFLLTSATPLYDDAGDIVRALVLLHDVTEQRLDERRRELLVSLGEALRGLSTPLSIMEAAAATTGEHLGVCSASYADVVGDHVIVHAEYRNGRVVHSCRYLLEDFGPQLIARIRRGHAVAVEDIAEDEQIAQQVFEGWHYRSLVAVPIMREGRLVALFSVLHTAPRRWRGSDVALMENVAERTWQAVERARAEAELQRSREWLGLALRAGAAAIWEWDLRSGHIRWSEEHEALIGMADARRELTFARWITLLHPDDRTRAKQAARHVATMRDGEIEFEYRFGGEPRWISMRGRVMADPSGVPYRVVGVALDITDRKQVELERERLLEETRDASEAKSHFISVISHEFRTPLTAVIGYADLLATGVSGALTPAQSRQLDRIRASAWHLTQMVDEILTFSRLEAGRETVHAEVVHATSLARETAALVAPGAAARGLGLACELPDHDVVIRTDSGKLRQVLLNLLSNAVKFTERGGVALRLRTGDGRLLFEVEDTGVGIAPEHIGRIFERFWQVGAAQSRTVSGAGLGLTVSRQLVQMLGGELTVTSTPGEGSTFRFSLPLHH